MDLYKIAILLLLVLGISVSVVIYSSYQYTNQVSTLRQQLLGNSSIDPIVGMWLLAYPNTPIIYKFYSDGTFYWAGSIGSSGTEINSGIWNITGNGTYTLSGKYLDNTCFEYSPVSDRITECDGDRSYFRYTERNVPLSSPTTALEGPGFVYIAGVGEDDESFRVSESQKCSFIIKDTSQNFFSIHLRDAQWNPVDILVVTSGSYSGITSEQLSSGNYTLDVTASGPWSVQILC